MSGEVGDEISKSRIETLTDGVFAIVMTLLVLEIAVPQLSHSEATAELPKQQQEEESEEHQEEDEEEQKQKTNNSIFLIT